MKTHSNPKLVLLGGGLANGLIALKLLESGYEDFLLIEKNKRLGGEHTWSFHSSDLSPSDLKLLKPMLYASWDQQRVVFAKYDRVLKNGYNSITSESFHNYLFDRLPSNNVILNTEAVVDGAIVHAGDALYTPDMIVDGRGISSDFFKPCGYQKFFGMDVELESPHDLEIPIIMDASVVQRDGFRFIYSLPFSERSILVEDTRYSLTSNMNEDEYRHEVEAYIGNHYGAIKSIRRIEKYALPIPLEAKPQEFQFNRVSSGMRGGLFQPVTGYSFPVAMRFAQTLTDNFSRESDHCLESLRKFVRRWESNMGFYLMLNKMMFGAAREEERVHIFERFYKLNHSLIERFYRGELKYADRARLLVGKPPVPVGQALKALSDSSWLEDFR